MNFHDSAFIGVTGETKRIRRCNFMRQLTVIPDRSNGCQFQTHAGILDWLFGAANNMILHADKPNFWCGWCVRTLLSEFREGKTL